jgi:UPF0042 nucleotide-binding protein
VDSIARERGMLLELRATADLVIDTSDLNVHELRGKVQAAFGREEGDTGLLLTVSSFGFKYGLPLDADMVLDVRFLPNPFFVDELKRLAGVDAPVARYVMAADGTAEFLEHAQGLLSFVLPRYEREGKSYATIGVGCTGGRHRSVVIVEELARRLASLGGEGGEGPPLITTRHRDMEKA